jgi:uncharacterized cupin superfamily protein
VSAGVINLADVELTEMVQGERFAARSARLGPLLGAKALGVSLIVVLPGKCSCPFHSHRANEEMFIVLEGQGSLRYGDSARPVRAGDVISCPVGGPETAHQIVNDSSAKLRYLALSTKITPEVCEYPDSKKVLAYDGKWGHMTRTSADVDYWEGEA